MVVMSRPNKKQITEAALLVPQIALREDWVFTLDNDEGNFYYSPKVVDNDAKLYQVTDEYAIYLNSALKPCGVMVEYFNDNYVEHHPAIKRMGKTLFVGPKDTIVINPASSKRKKDTQAFKLVFESFLITEALQGGHCKRV